VARPLLSVMTGSHGARQQFEFPVASASAAW